MMNAFSRLSAEQIETRYGILPPNIVGALSSESVKVSTHAIAQEFGLQGNEIVLFSMVVSLVFMGFIHPDNLADEIADIFEIPHPKAEEITLKLRAQVFALYRSDIEKVYVPPVPEVPKPASLPAAATTETLNLKVERAPAPFAGSAPATFPKPGVMPAVNLAAKSPVGVGASSAAPAPAPAPKPFVLHKESASETVVASSGFRLNLEQKSFGSFPGRSAPPPPAPRTARLELGQEVKKAAPQGFSMPASQQKVVHYSDMRSDLGQASSIMSGLKAAPAPQPLAPSPAPGPSPVMSIRNAPGVAPQSPAPAAPMPVRTPAPSPAAPKAPPKVVNFTADGGNAVK